MAMTLKIVNGDMVALDNGEFDTIEGLDCTKQCIAESLQIAVQPNGFGAGLVSLKGTVARDELAMQMLVVNGVTTNFKKMRALQKASSIVPREKKEIVSSSIIVSAGRDQRDPRRYKYSAKILTEAGLQLTASGQMTL